MADTEYKDVPLYRYKKLEEHDTIRILELHATKGLEIGCNLRHISCSVGGYQAISYVWGSEDRPYRAIVRNEEGNTAGYIPLTENLKDALCDLRDAKGLPNNVFWIDQICIDQKSDEKNHQVKLMGKIYESAVQVVTYIGPAAEKEEQRKGLDLLRRLNQHFDLNYSILSDCLDLPAASARVSELPVRQLPDNLANQVSRYEDCKWLLEVALGEWTTRLWIVQEQLLNMVNVMLRGPDLLPWGAVAIIPTLFSLRLLPSLHIYRFWEEPSTESRGDLWGVANSVFSTWRTRQGLKKDSDLARRSLLQNMTFYEDLRCRDPRDRIFSLLAISSDTADMGIEPDYSDSNSNQECFRKASVRILQQVSDLWPLAYACRWDNSDMTLPSWSLYVPRPPMSIAITLLFDVFTPHPHTTLTESPRFSSDGCVLVLKGRVLDQISTSTSQITFSRSFILDLCNEERLQDYVRILSGILTVASQVNITLSAMASLFRTLIAASNWLPGPREGRSASEEAVFHLWYFLREETKNVRKYAESVGADVRHITNRCEKLIASLANLLPGTQDFNKAIDDDLSEKEINAAAELRTREVFRERTFCNTAQNRFCNGMNEVQVGDVVAAIHGSDRLWVLRPAGSRYRLIGDAYIDGLMRGEAYEGVDSNDVDSSIGLI